MRPPKAGTKFAEMVNGFLVAAPEYVRWFESLSKAPATSSAVTLSASPSDHTFENGFVLVSGGTVSSIQYRRGATGSFTTTGQTAGQLIVKSGDSLRITYTVAPTVTYFPD